MLVRRIARPLLASSFVYGGIDTLRNPQSRVPGAAPVVDQIAAKADQQLPVQLPRDVEQWVKVDAGVKVAAGSLLGVSSHVSGYAETQARRVRVVSRSGPQVVAYDGETGPPATEFDFAKHGPLTVYCRRTEQAPVADHPSPTR